MSVECSCDECNKSIGGGEFIICRRCYQELVDEIRSLEKQLEEKPEAQ